MKILRYIGERNKEFYGKLVSGESVKPIEGDIFGDFSEADRAIKRSSIKRMLPPVDPPDVIAIGLNYKAHADESGSPYPSAPVIFLKATSSVIGPEEKIVLPHTAPDEVDYEAELAVVIGRTAHNVAPREAADYILGYTCANDVSARDCQTRLDRQWARAKSFDTFCPIGPCIASDIDPNSQHIELKLNGEVMQDSNTSDLIFPVYELVSYVSMNMTLRPGTVILTGTPSGVGFTRNPPVFLRPGDTVEVVIDGIGTLTNTVVAEEPPKNKDSA